MLEPGLRRWTVFITGTATRAIVDGTRPPDDANSEAALIHRREAGHLTVDGARFLDARPRNRNFEKGD